MDETRYVSRLTRGEKSVEKLGSEIELTWNSTSPSGRKTSTSSFDRHINFFIVTKPSINNWYGFEKSITAEYLRCGGTQAKERDGGSLEIHHLGSKIKYVSQME
jgi:hypothetical protein